MTYRTTEAGERVATLPAHDDADLVSEIRRRITARRDPEKLLAAVETAVAQAKAAREPR